MNRLQLKYAAAAVILLLGTFTVNGAKLSDIQIVDQDFIMIHVLDGEVASRDDGIGETAFNNFVHENDRDTVKRYTPELNTDAAETVANWTITSDNDDTYGSSGEHPSECFRKTKMNGHAEQQWSGGDYHYEYTYEHWIYLKLPQSLQQGKSYTLTIEPSTNIATASSEITYNIFQSVSEAIHINLAGYHPDPAIKAADVYIWMGDGGARDYSGFEDKKVFLYDVNNKETSEVGTVSFWKQSGKDIYSYNLTRSDVWNADFSAFTKTGTYRLAIEGVGCSRDFTIDENVFHDPFMVSVQGFFYMRIGQDSTPEIRPVPRRPLYIPGVSPENTTVYLTTMHPYHKEFGSFSSGDVWDRPNDWAKYKKSGNPTNPAAYGGHSDALDWDRHLGHISIIWDMLLPYFLTKGVISDDNLDIAESGNGIPDILDEARNEVDFWLRLRDGQGYSHGLTNPNKDNEFFQAAPTAVAAWANAANAAMLADCFRICSDNKRMTIYRDSALNAFTYASSLPDQMLDNTQGVGDFTIRGRDLKMMAAAFLYNVTGDTEYEDIIKTECVVENAASALVNSNKFYQLYAAAAYLFTPQEIHYQELYNNIKVSVISEAKSKEADFCAKRPSRRATDEYSWYFRTAQNVHHCIIAHAITTDATEKKTFRKAMVLEADWGLGRNPLNMIQMTTASTPLETRRSVPQAYTTGSDDGTPGMHPGHTPYMNLNDWDQSMTMGSPSKLYKNCYPGNFKENWPIGEGYFNTPYVWAHNEFTPQQTMRGKMALYGYLYGITKGHTAVSSPRFVKHDSKQLGNNRRRKDGMINIYDLCGRVIWSGKMQNFNREHINKKISGKTVLIQRVNGSHSSIQKCTVLRLIRFLRN